MKALIVAPAWVGDLVMSQVLVQVLEHEHPGIEIHLVAPPATAPLADRLPGLAGVHELAVGHGEPGLRRRFRMARALRRHDFQVAYVLPNSFKSALLPWWAGIPRRMGWHGEARYLVLTDRRRLDTNRYPRMVDRFASLATAGEQRPPVDVCRRPSRAPAAMPQDPDTRGEIKPRNQADDAPPPADGWPQDGLQGCFQPPVVDDAPPPDAWLQPELRVDEANRTSALQRLGLGQRKPITVLCPGAEYGAAKRWPAGHFAAVARNRLRAGHAVWLMGSAGDAEVARRIAGAAPGVSDLTGRTSLPDAVDLLSLADAVVTNDSGLMHVACALGRRVVAVFGSTSPEFTPPLSPHATVIEDQLDCRPCFRRECPLQHLDCLRGIAPERVLVALEEQPGQAP